MTGPHSLPHKLWPAAERAAWETACASGERLRRGGAASHLRPITRDDLAKRYGLFLDYVSRCGRLDTAAAAGAHVAPENVEGYVAELRRRVSSVTLYGSIYKLRRATELMAPDHEVSWLRELENDLDLMKRPKSKLHRLVLAEVLVAAGLTLMTEADAAEHRTALQRATQYRNGLMIALLACCPIRLKNFAALSLGETLVQIDDCWWIILTADQTKEKRPDERRIPDFLGPYLDRYVSEHRPVLAKSEKSNTACWLSRGGTPMSYLGVEEAVTRTTAATTGIAVSPHLFRTSAATTAAIHAGTTPYLASAVLDHRDTATTQRHYNRASSLTAGKAYRALGEIYRNDI